MWPPWRAFPSPATIPVLGVPLLLAVLLNRSLRLGTLLRSAFFFPQTLSVVTLGLVWVWMRDPLVGPVNYYLKLLGFSPPVWFGDPRTAMLSIRLRWPVHRCHAPPYQRPPVFVRGRVRRCVTSDRTITTP
jgi:hypothetical protein